MLCPCGLPSFFLRLPAEIKIAIRAASQVIYAKSKVTVYATTKENIPSYVCASEECIGQDISDIVKKYGNDWINSPRRKKRLDRSNRQGLPDLRLQGRQEQPKGDYIGSNRSGRRHEG